MREAANTGSGYGNYEYVVLSTEVPRYRDLVTASRDVPTLPRGACRDLLSVAPMLATQQGARIPTGLRPAG